MAGKCSKRYILVCILLLAPLVGAGVDIFSPALPLVVHHFDSTSAKFTIGIYILVYGISQVFVGPFVDAIGHKKLMMWGLLFYVVSSFGAGLVDSLPALFIFRALQGVAVAIPVVVLRAIPASIFSKEEMPIKMNYVTMCWSLGPIVAPFIGGYLTHYINWHSTLLFLGLYGLAIFLLYIRVPETAKVKHPLDFKSNFKVYREMLTNKCFMGVFVGCCLMYGLILIFNVVGPFLIQNRLGMTPVDFGYIALLMGLGVFLGNVFNRYLLGKYNRRVSMNIIIVVGLLASIVMLVIGLAQVMNAYVIAIPTFFLFLVAGMTFGNLYGVPFQLFPEHPGKASALFGALFVSGAGILTSLSALLKSHNQISLSVVNLVIVVLVLFFYIFTFRQVFKKHG